MIRTDYDSRLPLIISRLDEQIDEAARLTANAIASDAKSRVPVAGGSLRDSIHVDKEGEGSYYVVAGDSDVFYGHLVENGTTKMPPRPFLVPAAEAEKQHIDENGRRALSDLT